MYFRWSAILLVMVSHLLREKDNRGLYDAIAPLLNIFQTAAVLEVSMKWAARPQNLSSGFFKKRGSNQSPQLHRLSRNLKILLVASLDIILSKKRITKALIRLRGCAGLSAPLLFANHRRQVFSHRGPNKAV